MMKAYINIKNNSNLHIHQTLNKSIWLMKRVSGRSTTHHFSFDKRFDETLMKVYSINRQYIRISNHQFIGFSALNKSTGKATEVNIAIRRLVGRTSVLPTDKEAGEKKKATDNSRHHRRYRRRLLGTKSHSSLGRFLHAPLTLVLKTPQ